MSPILIADDNPHAQRMGRQILVQEGYEVVTVSNGDEAIEYLSQNRPALVLADTRMPGPSGYEICRRIKHEGGHEGVRVVLLSGPLEPYDPQLAENVGSDAVLHKPLDAYSLIETVGRLIGKTETPAPVAVEAANEAAQPETDRSEADEHGPEPTPEPTAELADEPSLAEPPPPEFSAEPAPADESLEALLSGDPFGALVDEALGLSQREPARDARVREAVREVLEAAMPALVDSIAERVLARLDEESS